MNATNTDPTHLLLAEKDRTIAASETRIAQLEEKCEGLAQAVLDAERRAAEEHNLLRSELTSVRLSHDAELQKREREHRQSVARLEDEFRAREKKLIEERDDANRRAQLATRTGSDRVEEMRREAAEERRQLESKLRDAESRLEREREAAEHKLRIMKLEAESRGVDPSDHIRDWLAVEKFKASKPGFLEKNRPLVLELAKVFSAYAPGLASALVDSAGESPQHDDTQHAVAQSDDSLPSFSG